MGHSAGGYNAAMLALDPRWLAETGHKPTELSGFTKRPKEIGQLVLMPQEDQNRIIIDARFAYAHHRDPG